MAENRQAALLAVKNQCKDLLATVYPPDGRPIVMGWGDSKSSLMLVGEAPGGEEELQGLPFVGRAGRNLDEFLEHLQIGRDRLYITNTVKFRPVKVHPRTGSRSNRPPTREEVELCFSFLKREIEIVRPQVVVTLGNVALRAVRDDRSATIGTVHGAPLNSTLGEHAFALFPLYHPASIIYNRALGDTYRQDLDALREYLNSRGLFAGEQP